MRAVVVTLDLGQVAEVTLLRFLSSRCCYCRVVVGLGVVAMNLLRTRLTTFLLPRQSKLSPSQLDELQKATHFDKKELQQWYKGACDPGLK